MKMVCQASRRSASPIKPANIAPEPAASMPVNIPLAARKA
jgi:hypothetical protein